MIDVAEPAHEYTVAQFQLEARRHLGRGPVIVAGGSGLHFRAVVDPLTFPPHDPALRAELEALPAEEAVRRLVEVDPGALAVVDLANPRRVVRALEVVRLTGETPSARAAAPGRAAVEAYQPLWPVVAVGLDPGEALVDRVTDRLRAMRAAGLVEEVAGLAGRMGRTASQAVGYRQLLGVVAGTIGEDAGFAAAELATLALVRRQRTFFRRDPRITWLDPSAPDLADTVSRLWEGS
jgi:tRNA dimethylallyltransferase